MPHSSVELSLEQLRGDVHAALRAWQSSTGKPENLLDYLLLVQRRREKNATDGSMPALRRATNEILLEGIEEIEQHDETAGRVLKSRFVEGNLLDAVSHQLNISSDSVSRIQRTAIEQLAKLLYEQETQLRREQAQQAERQLPRSSYTTFYGQDETQAELAELLLQPHSPWIVAVVGMGGTGKTALADKVTRQIIRHLVFERVAWVRLDAPSLTGRFYAPQQGYEDLIRKLFTAFWPDPGGAPTFEEQWQRVHREMKSRPCLVVIDNLESETDTAYLLDQISSLVSPSKILLTTRTHVTGQATAYGLSISELSLVAAGELLRGYARDIGVKVVEEATPADVQKIYNVVGGNPLALKLVVSLLSTLPLTQVLSALENTNHREVEKMYRDIYWQAWQLLSHPARKLLKAMPVVSDEGGDAGYLRSISGLSEGQFWPALQELRSRSLLEVWGTLYEKLYGIHRLTETFLRTEIIKWPDEEAERESKEPGGEDSDEDYDDDDGGAATGERSL